VLDFVGVDATLGLGAAVARPLGDLTIVGIGGGTLPVSFFSVGYEVSIQTTYWGSRPELVEVLNLGPETDPPGDHQGRPQLGVKGVRAAGRRRADRPGGGHPVELTAVTGRRRGPDASPTIAEPRIAASSERAGQAAWTEFSAPTGKRPTRRVPFRSGGRVQMTLPASNTGE
jgi:hypothetical protein